VKIFVQTRGRATDYAFLADAPTNRWWLDFRDGTSFEQPTLIVSGDKKNWHCFLSGIPSSRVDRVGTTVRYSIAVEGSCQVKDESILNLIAAWLEDATSSTPKGRVHAALDYAFDETTVERLLSIRSANVETTNEVEKLSLNALSILAVPKPSIGKIASESWVGSTTSPDAKNEFLARCCQLIVGNVDGTAAVLNLLGTTEEVASFANNYKSLAALIDDESGNLRRIVPIEKKKTLDLPPAMPPTSEPTVPWTRIAVALGAIFLLILVVRLKAPNPPQGNQFPNASHQVGK
jgi:hypothetical protein